MFIVVFMAAAALAPVAGTIGAQSGARPAPTTISTTARILRAQSVTAADWDKAREGRKRELVACDPSGQCVLTRLVENE
jgi:hypothetical protein